MTIPGLVKIAATVPVKNSVNFVQCFNTTRIESFLSF